MCPMVYHPGRFGSGQIVTTKLSRRLNRGALASGPLTSRVSARILSCTSGGPPNSQPHLLRGCWAFGRLVALDVHCAPLFLLRNISNIRCANSPNSFSSIVVKFQKFTVLHFKTRVASPDTSALPFMRKKTPLCYAVVTRCP